MLVRWSIQLSNSSATGARQGGWWFAQTQQDLVAVVDHAVGGEADDAAEGLGVEQDDRGHDP